jgi:branched-chain amino acid transport system ATP-binding protein
LVKTIMGYTTLYGGSIMLDIVDLSRLRVHERARLGLVYIPQLDEVFPNLTVEDNLVTAGVELSSVELESRLRDVLDVIPLRDRLRIRAGRLSGGERKLLAMGMALMRRPRFMLMDEPTAGLSPRMAKLIFDKVLEIRNNLGVGIVLVEQNARKALEIGDKAYLLVTGRVRFEGNPRDLLNEPNFEKIFLGLR